MINLIAFLESRALRGEPASAPLPSGRVMEVIYFYEPTDTRAFLYYLDGEEISAQHAYDLEMTINGWIRDEKAAMAKGGGY